MDKSKKPKSDLLSDKSDINKPNRLAFNSMVSMGETSLPMQTSTQSFFGFKNSSKDLPYPFASHEKELKSKSEPNIYDSYDF